jgi:chromosome segregation ATPase
MTPEEINRRHEEQIRVLDAAQPRNSLVDRLAAAEAELRDLSEQATKAYRHYAELDMQAGHKANEIKELRLQIREEAAP